MCRKTFVLAVYSRRGQMPFLLLRIMLLCSSKLTVDFLLGKLEKKVLNPVKGSRPDEFLTANSYHVPQFA